MKRMRCPKKDVLSAFFDGEIGAPWDAVIAAHVKACARCRARLAALGAVSARLQNEEAPGLAEALLRVKGRIDCDIAERNEDAVPVSAFTGRLIRASDVMRTDDEHLPFFRRQVVLPMPFLVGGLAAMFVLVASLFFFVGKSGNDLFQARAELENLKTIHVQYTIHDRNQLLGLINHSMNSNQDVVFELPDDNSFRVGRPEVVYIRERK